MCKNRFPPCLCSSTKRCWSHLQITMEHEWVQFWAVTMSAAACPCIQDCWYCNSLSFAACIFTVLLFHLYSQQLQISVSAWMRFGLDGTELTPVNLFVKFASEQPRIIGVGKSKRQVCVCVHARTEIVVSWSWWGLVFPYCGSKLCCGIRHLGPEKLIL